MSAADAFLRKLKHYYDQQSMLSHWVEPTGDSPYPSLILRFDEIGERHAIIDLELCFLPGIDDFAREGVYIMQSFAVLRQDVPVPAYAALLSETALINIDLPLGSFGLFADSGTLYFKHNAFHHIDWLNGPLALEHADRQNAMIVHQFYLFADTLLNIADAPAPG